MSDILNFKKDVKKQEEKTGMRALELVRKISDTLSKGKNTKQIPIGKIYNPVIGIRTLEGGELFAFTGSIDLVSLDDMDVIALTLEPEENIYTLEPEEEDNNEPTS